MQTKLISRSSVHTDDLMIQIQFKTFKRNKNVHENKVREFCKQTIRFEHLRLSE